MWRVIIWGVVTLSLAGCAIAAKVNARNDMEQSKAAYKVCLEQHPSEVSVCEAFEKAYEADLKALRAVTSGTDTIVVTE